MRFAEPLTEVRSGGASTSVGISHGADSGVDCRDVCVDRTDTNDELRFVIVAGSVKGCAI